jgi:hypothetical protein
VSTSQTTPALRCTGLPERGVLLAVAVAESLVAVVGVLVFRRGTWREHVV